jgi:competence protein CoiA
MKYAIVDGVRREAARELAAECPACGAAVMPKCGAIRDWHWAHRGQRHCDPWREGETDWHRNWKNAFPTEWQEFVLKSESGEKHVADVRTVRPCVIEFQHSHIDPEERAAREAFYRPMVWVVDGLRRKRDKTQFERMWSSGAFVSTTPLIKLVKPEGALLRDWSDSRASVYFDFGGVEQHDPYLWCLLRMRLGRGVLVMPVLRAHFIEAFHKGEPCKGITGVLPRPRATGLPAFERYLALKRARSRSRF